jgi:dihydroanticapsin dehydrogenase
MKRAIITGASSGLGKAIALAMTNYHSDNNTCDIEIEDWSLDSEIDVTDEGTIIREVANLKEEGRLPDILINCAGVNHIEFIPKLRSSDWDFVMDTNAKGLFLTTKHLADHMRGGTILNIVSNASHMPMTSSLAYNASKGAAEIMTKQMSRELIKTHNITVFGISPNKLCRTGMSDYIDRQVMEQRGWTMQQAREYQLASLPAGEETDPDVLAEFIAFLLSEKRRHKYLAGCIIQYGL